MCRPQAAPHVAALPPAAGAAARGGGCSAAAAGGRGGWREIAQGEAPPYFARVRLFAGYQAQVFSPALSHSCYMSFSPTATGAGGAVANWAGRGWYRGGRGTVDVDARQAARTCADAQRAPGVHSLPGGCGRGVGGSAGCPADCVVHVGSTQHLQHECAVASQLFPRPRPCPRLTICALQLRRSPEGCTAELLYMYDGDKNGVCWHLGTGGGSQPWVNPVIAGRLQVRVSVGGGGRSLGAAVMGGGAARCVLRCELRSVDWLVTSSEDHG